MVILPNGTLIWLRARSPGYKDNGGSGGGASGGSGTQQGGTQQGGTQSGGSGISLSGLLFLAWNEDGTYYATEDKNDPNILTSFPNYIPEPELLYNGYFYYSGSASIQALKDDTIECEYNGETYTFSRKVNISTSKKEGCLGTVNLEKLGAELLPGFAPSAGNGMGGGFMNIGWAVFLRSSTNEGGLNSEPDIGWTVTDYNLPFTDVTKYGSHEYVMVAWAYENGIVNGTGNGTTFESNAALTRAQAVTLLWRAAKSPAAAGSANPFTDVAAGRYYTEAVLWAVDKGIVLGDGATTFEPDRAVSHEEFVLMLHRFAGAGGNAVAWAAENGIADVAESLGGVCSRFQAVAYLYRYMGN